MKPFKTKNELEKFLLEKCKAAVTSTEQKVHSIIDNCLRQFYSQFEPEEYIRTEQLLHSLVKSGVKKVGNGYEAEVYFDVGKLNYEQGLVKLQSGNFGVATWDEETVLRVAMTGDYGGKPHGGWETGTAIWTKSMATINTLGGVLKMIERELNMMGVRVKK